MKFWGRRKRKKVFISTSRERVNFGRYISDTKKTREQYRNMYIIYSETGQQPRLDAWDKCSGLVHWDDPEESGGEGGGRGDWDGEYM